MDLKVKPVVSILNYKQYSTTLKDETKKKPATSFQALLKNMMKQE